MLEQITPHFGIIPHTSLSFPFPWSSHPSPVCLCDMPICPSIERWSKVILAFSPCFLKTFDYFSLICFLLSVSSPFSRECSQRICLPPLALPLGRKKRHTRDILPNIDIHTPRTLCARGVRVNMIDAPALVSP